MSLIIWWRTTKITLLNPLGQPGNTSNSRSLMVIMVADEKKKENNLPKIKDLERIR